MILLKRYGALAATSLLVLAAGCGDKSAPASSPTPSPAPAPASTAVQPAPSDHSVTPHAPETGPAAGGSAIGGVAADPQQQGAVKKGDAPAPTGGDGASK